MKSNIDFVVTWVDGSDPKWRAEKEKYTPEKKTDNRESRYRDWDNLRYWFRGVEKYAPWVNHIYFVTHGHIPKWLNVDNPKLSIVKHSDYIDQKFLPTLNSHVIELHLHRIKGLSEKFVYFNDDTFIIDRVKPNDFFKKGKPVDIGLESAINTNNKKMYGIYYKILSIINTDFSKKKVINLKKWFSPKYGTRLIKEILSYPWSTFIGFYNTHCPQPYLKNTFNEVWKKHEDILEETSMHRFRSEDDVNQYLFRYWQLCNNNFVPRKINFSTSITVSDSCKNVCNVIKKQKNKMLCINDSDSITAENFERFKKEIIESFNIILKDKSSFEK